MRQIYKAMQGLPGIGGPAARAPWPVWKHSTMQPVRFQPMTVQQARRLYRKAEDFEAQTRQPGRQDGALGRNGLRVLDALLFRFLSFKTGQLDPAYKTIARRAIISVRSVARGLQALKAAGVLHWIRRCSKRQDEAGGFLIEQESNAYAVRPVSQWRGFLDRPEAPSPDPLAWGAAPMIERGTVEAGTFDAAYERQEIDAGAAGGCVLAAALARLGRTLDARKSPASSESASLAEKHAAGLIISDGTPSG